MTEHAVMANAIRFLAMDAVEAANSGHPGMPMGMAAAATALFANHMRIDPSRPDWPDRDRFVLSAGHGSMLLYAVNHLLGYEDMPMEQLKNFRQLGSRTAGHPEFGHADGIETTTGPLGQGLATAVGMAIAERLLAARFGADLVDHHTYVLMGDGCLMEGISHEAIDMAGHLRLGKLICLWDDNAITIDGGTDLSTSTDQKARFEASGWHVQSVDGHDFDAVDAAIATAKADPRPSMVACKTTIGYGADAKAGTAKAHGSPLGDAEIAHARSTLGWPHAPFEVPQEAYDGWRAIAKRGAEARIDWENRLAGSDDGAAFDAAVKGALPEDFSDQINAFKRQISADKPSPATRKASEMALEVVNAATDLTIGGSADLTGSNNTRTKDLAPITAQDFSGRYMFYGVREHGMAAAMNGMALHGGVIPYGGAFLVFADYLRASLRLSALMGRRVIYVLTHDSIGLGEDGPTHQPVETLSMLRATPNLMVFRPCDAVETAEAWECALRTADTPSVLALTRQGLPTLRTDHTDENRVAKGGYVLSEPAEGRDVTLIGTGSEVSLAVEAAAMLAREGIKAAVVSLPCWWLFDAQEESYRAQVLGSAPRVAIEAAVEHGWSKYTGDAANFVGMTGFGASAPAKALYTHFGITAEALAAKAKAVVQG